MALAGEMPAAIEAPLHLCANEMRLGEFNSSNALVKTMSSKKLLHCRFEENLECF